MKKLSDYLSSSIAVASNKYKSWQHNYYIFCRILRIITMIYIIVLSWLGLINGEQTEKLTYQLLKDRIRYQSNSNCHCTDLLLSNRFLLNDVYRYRYGAVSTFCHACFLIDFQVEFLPYWRWNKLNFICSTPSFIVHKDHFHLNSLTLVQYNVKSQVPSHRDGHLLSIHTGFF